MKIHDVTQGSLEWLEARLGIPTASEFDKIVTPLGKLSAQARTYAIRLVTETLLRRSLTSIESLEWVARGKELEPQAARLYEFHVEMETTPIGFITTDDGRIGASPDRLVGVSGLLEIKCPAPQTHMGYLLDGFDKGYRPQTQGQLLVAECEFVDWMSYSPEMPPVIVRAHRDETYLKILALALEEFCELRDELLERARSHGLFAERKRLATVVDDLVSAEAAIGWPPEDYFI